MNKKKLVIEKFRRQDIREYEELSKTWGADRVKCEVDVEYESDDVKGIKLPLTLFQRLLDIHCPSGRAHLPWKILIRKLERGDNPWLKDCGWLGYQNDDTKKFRCDLSLDPDMEYPTVALLWLMFHEFRHKMQFEDKNICSCIINTNRDLWLHAYENPDMAMHVLHEIEPGESDANIFASEILEIPYPGSKFAITKERLKLLKFK